MALPLLVLVGVVFSVLLALQPLYAGGLVVAIAGTYVFIRHFEQAVLGILLMRSVLDMYSAQQIPALFAVGVDGLVFLYLGRQWILRRQVHTEPFCWDLYGWVMVQSTWVLLLAANGLGGTPDMAFEAMREWTRFFSLAMVYLLVMQLRDRISP
ncbi:MAG: polymerase, partial [Cyanobacteria bacterium J06627_32]